MSLPQITIVGRLGAEPELRFTSSGKAVVKLRVASAERKRQPDGTWKDGDECWLDVSAWEKMAENAAESLTKGDAVIITGKLTQRSYEANDGTKRTVYEVRADSIGPDVRWAIAKPHKVERASQTSARVVDDPWANGGDDAPF